MSFRESWDTFWSLPKDPQTGETVKLPTALQLLQKALDRPNRIKAREANAPVTAGYFPSFPNNGWLMPVIIIVMFILGAVVIWKAVK